MNEFTEGSSAEAQPEGTGASESRAATDKMTVEKVGFFQSIKVRAWAGIFVLTLLPLLALGGYSFNILGEIARDILIEGNIQAFQQVKYEVDQYVSGYDELTGFLASDVRLQQPQTTEARQALQQLDQAYEYVERIVLCSADGQLISHSKPDLSAITELSVPEKLLLGMSDKIFFSPEAFHVKAAISTAPDAPVIIATISFLKLRKSLEGITFGTNFRYFLVTQNGENILEQPDFPKNLIADLMEKQCGAYDLLPSQSGLSPQLVISLPILQYGLRIFVFQSAGEVYAVARSIGKKTFNFTLLMCLVAFILATYFSHRMTSPVIEIARKATELSEGNLEATVAVTSRDEIGFLASSFNNMSYRIRKKVFELSAMYHVTQLINTSATYQQALDGCLEHLIKIFQAKRGSIMLLSEDKTRLRVESFKQADKSAAENDRAPKARIELKIGEGIAGEVAETGQAILCMDCKSDERFKNYDTQNDLKSPDTLISAPLMVHGNTMGVINLTDRSNSRAFTGDDLDLLLAITKQMAMSIDNARLHDLSITDGLTELYIRRFFEIRLEDEIKRARRFKFPLTLVMFDIDELSQVNEKHGRKAGDVVLYEIARIIKDSVRATDIPARFGEEEFAIILAHTTAEQSLIFAERLRERIAAQKITTLSAEVQVTISVGIGEYEPSIERQYQLVEHTTKAIAQSKQGGKNRTTTWKKEQKS
ncbi:MAG: diguanylate cyclase [Candidatus Riflebacteria bacterium]|nr:diguanylate cyclase [Candidatus Riflebacteria bacterium]